MKNYILNQINKNVVELKKAREKVVNTKEALKEADSNLIKARNTLYLHNNDWSQFEKGGVHPALTTYIEKLKRDNMNLNKDEKDANKKGLMALRKYKKALNTLKYTERKISYLEWLSAIF
jgi:hypothetical protein